MRAPSVPIGAAPCGNHRVKPKGMSRRWSLPRQRRIRFVRTTATLERGPAMHPCQLDHLTVTAPTLAQGAAFVRDALGAELQPGGEHPRMGTHNLLLRLGDTLFL